MKASDIGTFDLAGHWELIQRGIYRRDNCLALYAEVERLTKLLGEAYAEIQQSSYAEIQQASKPKKAGA